MSRGRPFQKGDDERRNTSGRGPAVRTSIATLAKDHRPETFRRLAELADQDADLKVALAATQTLAAYSDGKPVDAAPDPEEKAEDKPDAALLKLLQPPKPEGEK